MRSTFDLPDDLLKRAKIAAVKRGSTLRELVAEALRRLLAEQAAPERKRMTGLLAQTRQRRRSLMLRSNRWICSIRWRLTPQRF
jgi:hypothetical protein